MTVHKLTAGDGYRYLTSQVASADQRRDAGQGLADYYQATGNPAGRWLGSGAASLGVAGAVSEAQMRALFGAGMHPDADRIIADAVDAGLPRELAESVARLGRRYSDFVELPARDERIAKRLAALPREPTPAELARIRDEEAARDRRPVAGYDLVFTPVKSASVLWALGDERVRLAVEAAHHEAVAQTVEFLEEHAAFTRLGAAGARQVDTHGLVCAAFDHRDSRSGDPDLHTHLVVANKVRARVDKENGDPRWVSLDGRALFAVGVAASERYNTRFEDALARRLGVTFSERADSVRANRRPVREIDGVPVELIRQFSTRRAAIEDRHTELLAEYRRDHGREPSQATQLSLAQQATLETREAKAPARSLAQMQADWRASAASVVGERRATAVPTEVCGRAVRLRGTDDVDVDALACSVLETLPEHRATWTRWNLIAEVERQTRALRFATAAERDRVVNQVVARACDPDLAVRIGTDDLGEVPPRLRRADGECVLTPHGAERYTTTAILTAEAELLDAANEHTGDAVRSALADAVLAELDRSGVRLDDDQRQLARAFCVDDRRIVVGIGPAGSGKTTATRAAAAVWAAADRRVVPLAPSAAAASVLSAELGLRAENLHKFCHEIARGTDDEFFQLRSGDVVLVDEAGMAGSLRLQAILRHAAEAGASVRLLGDPAQLGAVESGGALRLLAHDVDAAALTGLRRFADPAEAAATMRLRDGDPTALDFYESAGRIRAGTRDQLLEDAYTAWRADVAAGRIAVMVAADNDDVSALCARARLDRIAAGQIEAGGVTLAGGNRAGVGDWIVTRRNQRTLALFGGNEFVKNGDVWTVTSRHADGSLEVTNHAHGGQVRLPADYAGEHVELAYATTAHRAQGSTVDLAHALITEESTRETLYVSATRARHGTTLYVVTGDTDNLEHHAARRDRQTARGVLEQALRQQGAEKSATETIRDANEAAQRLRAAIDQLTPNMRAPDMPATRRENVSRPPSRRLSEHDFNSRRRANEHDLPVR